MKTKNYLALGDSMSISKYTGQSGGGAVDQLHARLIRDDSISWNLEDRSFDGAVIEDVIREIRTAAVCKADIVTLTVGGNNLLQHLDDDFREYFPGFQRNYCTLLNTIRRQASKPGTVVIVGDIYTPASDFEITAEQDEALKAINAFIHQTVADHDFRLAKINEAFRGRDELLVFGIEPNLAGAKVIADLFYDVAFSDE